MKKIINACFYAIVFLINTNVSAQWSTTNQVIIPSPNASSLIKYAQFPVTMYAGLPDISIPIHTITNRDISIPISLSYHPSGVRVNEESSWVGLGWSLNAGGVIASVVRGLNDVNSSTKLINTRTYVPVGCGIEGSMALESSDCSYCQAPEPSDNADWEPDLFYFNFFGKTGTFFYDDGGTIYLNKDEKLKILKNGSGWKVTTSDGYVYDFNVEEIYTFNGTSTGANAWYLTQVTSPLNEIVTYEYNTTGIEVQNVRLDNDQIELYGSPTCAQSIFPSSTTPTLTYNTKYLSKINFTNGYFLFNANAAGDPVRQDLPNGKYLKNIQLFRGDNSLVKQFDFTTSYFTTTITSNTYRSSDSNNDITKRLKLDKVQENNPLAAPPLFQKPYTFSYNYDGVDQTKMLPAKTSYAMDFWGLYNGQTSNSRLLTSYIFNSTERRSNPANRNSDATKSIACMLSDVVYSKGSITHYDWQLNTNSNCSGNLTGGGLRILRITDNDGSGSNNIVKTFEYLNGATSTGKILSCPLFDRQVSRANNCATCLYAESKANTYFYLSRSGTGNPVGYDLVTMYQGTGGNGKTVYTYSNAVDEAPHTSYPGLPTMPSDQNGLLLSNTVYSNNSGSYLKVKESLYTYTTKTAGQYVYGMIKETLPIPTPCDQSSCALKKFLNFYRTQSNWVVPNTTTINEYKYDDQTLYNQYKTTFEYNSNTHKQLSRQIKTESDGKKTVTHYIYPADYTYGTNWIDNLTSNFIHSFPIEKVIYEEYVCGSNTCQNVLSGEIRIYKNTGKALSSETWLLEAISPLQKSPSPPTFALSNNSGTFSKDSNYKRRITYDLYDANNNLVQFTKCLAASPSTDDFVTSHIYSYGPTAAGGVLPIAIVENASKNQVAYSSFENSYAEGNWNYSGITYNVTDSKTGKRSVNAPATFTTPISNVPYRDYRVGVWAKNIAATSQTITINSTNYTVIPDGKWYYFEKIIGPVSITVSSASSSVLFDELRASPIDASMTTYTYDPLVGGTSTTTPNGITTSVEFDMLSRKIILRDQDKNIRKKFDYVDKQ